MLPVLPTYLRQVTGVQLIRAIALVVLCFATWVSTVQISNQREFPIGCDDFGYTRQAQLFRDNGLAGFDTRLETANSRRLLDVAKGSGFAESLWYQAVAPHCHHYKSITDKVLLQYPAGTGLIMALFEPETKQRMLRIVSVTGTVATAALLLAFAGNVWSIVLSAASAWVAGVAIFAGIGSDSVGPAILLSTVAGVLMAVHEKKKCPPLIALVFGVLIGLSASVRISNALIIVLVGVWLSWRFYKAPKLARFYDMVLYGLGVLVSTAPLLWGNFVNTGSPFITTYSNIDAAAPKLQFDLLQQGLAYYFSWTPHGVILIVALLLAITSLALHQRSGLLKVALLATLGSVAYFVTKVVRITYYTFACSAFMLGVASSACVFRNETKNPRRLLHGASFAFAVLLTSYAAIAGSNLTISKIELNREIQETLANDPIVWADIYGAPVINHYDAYSAKLNFANKRVQAALVEGLYNQNIQQFVLVDSDSMKTILERLESSWKLHKVGNLFGYDLFEIIEPKS